MWKLKLALVDTCVYIGKKIQSLGVRAQVKEILMGGKQLRCGYITSGTKFVFRSQSAKYFIFIQMSKEMWEFDDDGDLLLEKCVHGFLPDLFSLWKNTCTNHVVSIVLFARIFFKDSVLPDSHVTLNKDSQGRIYRDFYRVVIDWETRLDWSHVLIPLKREFIRFEKDILQRNDIDGSFILSGVNSPASEGNILEAINLALNPFAKHYIDRDLLRTGLSIVIITPSSGYFEVDKKLCRLTTQRMIDHGIGCDIVSLSKPPLYSVPLFQFVGKDIPRYDFNNGLQKTSSVASNDSSNVEIPNLDKLQKDVWDPMYYDDFDIPDIPERVFFNIPTWVDVSFYNKTSSKPEDNKFSPRFQVPKLQTLLLEPCLVVEKLDLSTYDPSSKLDSGECAFFSQYDSSVFVPNAKSESSVSSVAGTGIAGRQSGGYADGSQSLPFDSKSWTDHRMNEIEMRQTSESFYEEPTSFAKTQFLLSDSFSPSRIAPIKIRTRNENANSRFKNLSDQSNLYNEKFSSSFKGASSPLADNSKFIGGRISPKVSPGISTKTGYLQQNYINPCNPSKNIIRESSQVRRWQHVFPSFSDDKNDSMPLMKWKSLATPAWLFIFNLSLPVSTEFFPSADDLARFYVENTYTVTPADDVNPYQDDSADEFQRVSSLLVELVSQRISQGFQVISSTIIDHQPLPPINEEKKLLSGSKSILWQSIQPKLSTSTPYYLSLGDHVHKLFFDSSGKNVEVKRYTRRITYSTEHYSYKCLIWKKNMTGYLPDNITFSYSPLSNYAWNYLDHLIAGYQDEMTEALRFWRTRFLLIPLDSAPQSQTLGLPYNENLDEEELRIAGFNKFVELFMKSRWIQTNSGKTTADKNSRPVGLSIQLTTMPTSQYVREEWNRLKNEQFLGRENLFRRGSALSGSSETSLDSFGLNLSTSHPVSVILSALQHHTTGCSIKDRGWNFKIYKNVFIGSECVDWMLRTFYDITTREEAVNFGNLLVNQGFIEHANKKHQFLDGHYFYNVSKPYIQTPSKPKDKEKERSLFVGTTTTTNWFKTLSLTGLSESNNPGIEKYNPPIEISKRIVIDMDPLRLSTRREMAILHYDTIHNVTQCYHFQLHWLVCTPRLIEDLLQSWARIAEKCGLKFIEAPVDQAGLFMNDNPFQSIIPINFAVIPPAHADLFFESELAKRHGFILDIEADSLFDNGSVQYSYNKPSYKYTQFVHNSGVAFIQIIPGVGYNWVSNRLLSGSMDRICSSSINSDNLKASLTQFCSDGENLRHYWAELQKILDDTLNLVYVNIDGNVAQKSFLNPDAGTPMDSQTSESGV